MIHRDLKPENIMLGDFGSVLVMDWGLAKVLGKSAAESAARPGVSLVGSVRASEGDSGSTMAGSILGTPHYMSPEQARGEVETLDARSDIFALGVILFQLLHLRPLVPAGEPYEIVEKMGRGEFDLTAAKKPAPDSLLAVCRKALAFDREQRYASVEALQRDLTAYQAGFATSAEKAGAWKQIRLLIGRHKAATAGLAAVLIVGLTLGTQAILAGRRAEREGARAVAALEALRRQAPALRQLAESEENLQRFDSALEKLDGALTLEPGHLPSYWRRAWLFIGLERWADAAAALRVAQAKDPAQARQSAILPLLDRFAAASSDAERWTPGAATELFAHLKTVSAFAEVARHSARLQMGDAEKQKLVRQRLDEWLGKGRGAAQPDEEGRLKVTLFNLAVDTVEPLKGLPIGNLILAGARVTSLEPLRGMPLEVLDLQRTKISDLKPLHDLPLVSLMLSNTLVEDLTPLQGVKLAALDLSYAPVRSIAALHGMPLRNLNLRATKVVDLSPLKDSPLEKLMLLDCKNIADAEPLAGLPLKDLHFMQSANLGDLSFVTKVPLEVLRASGSFHDLSPLHGKTFRVIELWSSQLVDLAPLRGDSIHELLLEKCNRLQDLTPLLEVRDLEKLTIPKLGKLLEPLRSHPTLKVIGYRELDYQPVQEFWATYDKESGAQK